MFPVEGPAADPEVFRESWGVDVASGGPIAEAAGSASGLMHQTSVGKSTPFSLEYSTSKVQALENQSSTVRYKYTDLFSPRVQYE